MVRVISSLTASQGFLFSLHFQTPAEIECTDFSGGAANGGPGPSFPLVVLWAIRGPGQVRHLWNNPIWPPRPPAQRSKTPCSTRRGSRLPAVTSRLPAEPPSSEDGPPQRGWAAVEAVPGVRLVNDETRLVPEAKPFVLVGRNAMVVRGDIRRQLAVAGQQGEVVFEAAPARISGSVDVVDQTNFVTGRTGAV